MKTYLEFHKGFETMLKQYKDMGENVEDAVKECIKAGQESLYADYKDGLERHRDSGDAVDSLVIDPIEQDGNTFRGAVGVSHEKNKAGFMHARYQEFGAKMHKKGIITFAADPWKAPADDQIRTKYTKICRDIMKRRLAK